LIGATTIAVLVSGAVILLRREGEKHRLFADVHVAQLRGALNSSGRACSL
jgi:uncharacterized membrane protein